MARLSTQKTRSRCGFSKEESESVCERCRNGQEPYAVLQISQNASKPLKPLVLGNSSEVGVGDTVIAIGNPFGLSDTMTTGIVSVIDRSVPVEGEIIPNAIQTDAPINPGNSGGPLLDTRGKMIGMNTAILSGTNAFSGIGFAIPSNTITKIVPILIEKGYYPHGTVL